MSEVFDVVAKRVITGQQATKYTNNLRYAVHPELPDGVPLNHLKIDELGLRPHKTGEILTGIVVEMSQAEKDAVDAGELAAAKKAKMDAIDNNTAEKIALGFTYDGHLFSLSTQAQTNLDGLMLANANGAVTFPHYMSTKDDSVEYEVIDGTALGTIYMTAVGTIKHWYDTGRELKKQVRDAADLAAVAAVVDDR